MNHVVRFAVSVLIFFVAVSGCASRLEYVADHEVGIGVFQSRDTLEFDSAARASQHAKGDRQDPVNVLVLSGGGAWGAWGAGVLRGWHDSPIDPRPEHFDIITGLSTGALLATGAFINDDELLRIGYTEIDQKNVMRNRFPPYLSALWSPSIYDTSGLAELICGLVTDDVIDRVAAHSNAGENQRRLYVATAELDSGDLIFWDMTAIAQKKRYNLYRSVLYAAAAIPGGFQPVHIGGTTHVDGGTRTSLFLDESILSPVLSGASDLRIYVIVNGRAVMDPIKPVNRTLPIAFRSVSMVLSAQAWNNLRQVNRLAEDHNAVFWVSMVPPDYKTTAEHEFDRTEMNRLYKEGRKHAENNQWQFVRRPNAPAYFDTEIMQSKMQRNLAR